MVRLFVTRYSDARCLANALPLSGGRPSAADHQSVNGLLNEADSLHQPEPIANAESKPYDLVLSQNATVCDRPEGCSGCDITPLYCLRTREHRTEQIQLVLMTSPNSPNVVKSSGEEERTVMPESISRLKSTVGVLLDLFTGTRPLAHHPSPFCGLKSIPNQGADGLLSE